MFQERKLYFTQRRLLANKFTGKNNASESIFSDSIFFSQIENNFETASSLDLKSANTSLEFKENIIKVEKVGITSSSDVRQKNDLERMTLDDEVKSDLPNLSSCPDKHLISDMSWSVDKKSKDVYEFDEDDDNYSKPTDLSKKASHVWNPMDSQKSTQPKPQKIRFRKLYKMKHHGVLPSLGSTSVPPGVNSLKIEPSKSTVSSLNSFVASVISTIASVSSTVTSFKSTATSFDSTKTSFDSPVTSFDSPVTSFDSPVTLSSFKSIVESISSTVSSSNSTFGSVNSTDTSSNPSFGSVRSTDTSSNPSFGSVNFTDTSSNPSFGSARSTVTSFNPNFESLNTTVALFNPLFGSACSTVANLNPSCGSISSNVASFNPVFGSASSTVATLNPSFGSIISTAASIKPDSIIGSNSLPAFDGIKLQKRPFGIMSDKTDPERRRKKLKDKRSLPGPVALPSLYGSGHTLPSQIPSNEYSFSLPPFSSIPKTNFSNNMPNNIFWPQPLHNSLHAMSGNLPSKFSCSRDQTFADSNIDNKKIKKEKPFYIIKRPKSKSEHLKSRPVCNDVKEEKPVLMSVSNDSNLLSCSQMIIQNEDLSLGRNVFLESGDCVKETIPQTTWERDIYKIDRKIADQSTIENPDHNERSKMLPDHDMSSQIEFDKLKDEYQFARNDVKQDFPHTPFHPFADHASVGSLVQPKVEPKLEPPKAVVSEEDARLTRLKQNLLEEIPQCHCLANCKYSIVL